MRIALLADVHANLEALQAVREDIARRGGVDEYWHLGDIVDYGPDPHACIALLRQIGVLSIAGNHDLAAIGKIDASDFHAAAAVANIWTAGRLTPEERQYLDALPMTLMRGDFTLAHGSPRDPVWEYLLSSPAAQENFTHFETNLCAVGHTHIPVAFELTAQGCLTRQPGDGQAFPLRSNRCIINPGAVGQPRDGDPRAGYAIYDSGAGTVAHYRVHYDIPATQQKMRRAGLPERLVMRLTYGQ